MFFLKTVFRKKEIKDSKTTPKHLFKFSVDKKEKYNIHCIQHQLSAVSVLDPVLSDTKTQSIPTYEDWVDSPDTQSVSIYFDTSVLQNSFISMFGFNFVSQLWQ